MMTKDQYENLKTDSAHNQLRAIHKLTRNVGDSIDDAVQQMTYAMDLSIQFKSWMKKWDGDNAVTESDLAKANQFSRQTTSILSSLQSMSRMIDKVWLKSREMQNFIPPEVR